MAKNHVVKYHVAEHYRTAMPSHLDRHIEYRLDQELEQTFPASDAPQITRDRTPYHSHQRRRSKPAAVAESSRAPAR
jgi:hypothetical protein